MGATFEVKDALETKDQKVLGFRNLEYGYFVDYLEGKEPTDFWGQRNSLSRFQALLSENIV